MSSVLVMVITLAALVLGYVFYSRRVERWFRTDLDAPTPAVEINDGVDYVPVKHWTVLFGHHFASIAGAAPIIGPVVACMCWGWVPAALWIVVGGIFLGGVHDYCSLMLSAENKGRTVGDLSEAAIGRSGKIVFSIFVLLALTLVVAVFAAVAGLTLATTPEVVIPTFGLVFVALLVGFLVYTVGLPIWLDTFIGLALLFGLVWLGYKVPVDIKPWVENLTPNASESVRQLIQSPAAWWTVILIVYGMVAAVLPVTILLQPRDHLAAGVLFVGMFFGFLGVVVSGEPMHAPRVIAFQAAKQGAMWPMLFVVIACGAISGFHSLVASGTTSKQLDRMANGRRIGYGAMIMECALAVLALIAVTAGLFWTKAPEGWEGYVYQDLMAKKGWIGAFGHGYGRLTAPIFGSLGMLVGITMLKTFVMTTLDSATRITRYVCSELLGDTFGITPMKNRYVATLLVGVCAGALALGNWKAIWPIFGSSNQLIAAMVLIIATLYLLRRGRSWKFAAIPAALVFVTAMGALVYKEVEFLGLPEGKDLNILLASVGAVLIVLGLFVGIKGGSVLTRAPSAGSSPQEEV